ncbi:MAG: hypothetical protein J5762_03010 [Clostridia bacterium]|nr:hypothetical protein [Clostridia bacterium]
MKTCENCVADVKKEQDICPECGSDLKKEPAGTVVAPQTEETDLTETTSTSDEPKKQKRRKKRNTPVEVEKISENISLYDDGKYRWSYALNMFKNPIIFFTVWKIFFIIMSIGFIISFLVSLGEKDFFFAGFLNWLKIYGIAIAAMTAISYLGYAVYAAMLGGKYLVEFEMDEKGVLHTQTATQAKKAKKIGSATAVAGLTAGRLTTVGIGVNAASKTSSYTDFSAVKKVKVIRPLLVIKLNERFEHNQVYANKEDFDFVLSYVISHCPNAKKTK